MNNFEIAIFLIKFHTFIIQYLYCYTLKNNLFYKISDLYKFNYFRRCVAPLVSITNAKLIILILDWLIPKK